MTITKGRARLSKKNQLSNLVNRRALQARAKLGREALTSLQPSEPNSSGMALKLEMGNCGVNTMSVQAPSVQVIL